MSYSYTWRCDVTDAIFLPVEKEQTVGKEDYLQVPKGTLKQILVLL